MEIVSRVTFSDLYIGPNSPFDNMSIAIPGILLTVEWINDPKFDFAWANTTLLEKKLGEKIVYIPKHWVWYIQGAKKYPERERYIQFALASTPTHFGAHMKFWLREDCVIMVIVWVVNGRLESSGDDPVFHWALARVDFTPEQSRKLLEDDGKWLRLSVPNAEPSVAASPEFEPAL